jgi:hypothetical protein
VQLSLNFLTPPQPATPLERLEPGQRAELVLALARIITKAAGRVELPMIAEAVTMRPTEGTRHD